MPQDLRPSLFPSSSDFPEETSMGIWEVLRCCHDKPVEKSIRKWIILCLMKGLKGAPYIVQRPLWLGIGNIEYGVYAPSERASDLYLGRSCEGFGEIQCTTSWQRLCHSTRASAAGDAASPALLRSARTIPLPPASSIHLQHWGFRARSSLCPVKRNHQQSKSWDNLALIKEKEFQKEVILFS